jgi:hypothetical protein
MIVQKSSKKEEPKAAAPKAAAPAPAPAAAPAAPAAADNTIVYIAAAAVAAYLGTSTNNIIVTRVTPVYDTDTAWAKNALVQSMLK